MSTVPSDLPLSDFAVPGAPGLPGGGETRARWSPEGLARLIEALGAEGAPALARLGRERLLAAWGATVEAYLDPDSPERRRLDPALARNCRLSPEGLTAGLTAVLGGVRRSAAEALLGSVPPGLLDGPAEAEEARRRAPRRPALTLLASNLPALAVQPLLPSLLAGRPMLLKSPGAEPFFAPAFVRSLVGREPGLAAAVAAVTWPGGDANLEAPLLAAAGPVLAYGGQEAMDDLGRRLRALDSEAELVPFGPKTSLALVDPAGAGGRLEMQGLARDVALFDQRGCLSIAAVYVRGGEEAAAEVAEALAAALEHEARRLPPGPPSAAEAAAARLAREEAEMLGRVVHAPGESLAVGTVIVETDPAFRPSPGLRTVRVHPLPGGAAGSERLAEVLTPWAGRLQGLAAAGIPEAEVAALSRRLDLSRTSLPGELQSPDATWHNGGRHPLAVLAGRAGGPSR